MSATPFKQKFDFLQEGVVCEQRVKEGTVGSRILDHVCNIISKSAHQKGDLSATPFIQKKYFLKEGVVWEQNDKRRNYWKLDSRPCLQHHFKVRSATPFLQKFDFLKEGDN